MKILAVVEFKNNLCTFSVFLHLLRVQLQMKMKIFENFHAQENSDSFCWSTSLLQQLGFTTKNFDENNFINWET